MNTYDTYDTYDTGSRITLCLYFSYMAIHRLYTFNDKRDIKA
jgi:hypothetical protein